MTCATDVTTIEAAAPGDRLRKGGNRVLAAGIVLAAAGGAAYMLFRYPESTRVGQDAWGFGVSPLAYYVALVLVMCALITAVRQRTYCAPGSIGKLVLSFVALTIVVMPLYHAVSTHALENLVSLNSVGTDSRMYTVWSRDGSSSSAKDVPIISMHRQGDETCHLVAALAVAQRGAASGPLNQLLESGSDHSTPYWMKRYFAGHPLGLAVILAPIADNPPLSRAVLFGVFILTVFAAYVAGAAIRGDCWDGLLFAVLFGCIPDLLWWHAGRVSSDIMPALPAFLAVALVLTYCRNVNEQSVWVSVVQLAGASLLFALAISITYTAAMAAAATGMILLCRRGVKGIIGVALIGFTCLVTLVVCMKFSGAVLGEGRNVFNSRVADLSGEEKAFSMQGMTVAGFMMRLPQMIGIPILLVLAATFWRSFYRPLSWRSRLIELLAALLVVGPSIWAFWPQLRFMFPGWLIVLIGLGVPRAWGDIDDRWKTLTVSVVVAFSIAKFVTLRGA